jgi:hypothetical protein
MSARLFMAEHLNERAWQIELTPLALRLSVQGVTLKNTKGRRDAATQKTQRSDHARNREIALSAPE